ncbi:MAG TPA: HAD-IIB family hydrolase [Candidatus Baltobacteraceae bacterium]|nr:HAD-IIB family hydrolase [Candidatus Baltobacteraceae bacterium]
MRYLVLATDFDGTLAHDGQVAYETIEAIKQIRKSGRKVILVTGRLVESLRDVFPDLDLFDAIVAENGAVLYDAASHETLPLADPPSDRFIELLRQRGVHPLEIGEAIVSTWEPYEATVVEAIRDLGLERQVIFNKGAVMTLPSGVNKATGLLAALDRFDISERNTVGVGDAENDHAFLRLCELSAAVANALPAVKESADFVLKGDHGAGVVELAQRLLDDDCLECPTNRDRRILFGRTENTNLYLDPYVQGATLIVGASGSGKSTMATGIVERIIEHGYQVCIVDPEGDYDAFEGVVTLGNADRSPIIDEVESLLRRPMQNLAINLIGIPVDDRANFTARLMPRLLTLRAQMGRPHWIVWDEAHQLMRSERHENELTPRDVFNQLAITTRPSLLSEDFRAAVRTVMAVGADAVNSIREIDPGAAPESPAPAKGQALLWLQSERPNVTVFDIAEPKATLRRHRRKYALGDLTPEKSFYFRGKDGKLRLRAQNLNIFAQLAEGIDDETWTHHMRLGDIATWFSEMIGDDELADFARGLKDANPSESRKGVVEEIRRRYTAFA